MIGAAELSGAGLVLMVRVGRLADLVFVSLNWFAAAKGQSVRQHQSASRELA